MCKTRRTELPEALANAPQLLMGLESYFSAFWELSTERHIGMGLGQIPASAMRSFARDEGMDDDEYDRFRYLVRSMDDAWLAHQGEQAKRATSKKESET